MNPIELLNSPVIDGNIDAALAEDLGSGILIKDNNVTA